MCCVAGCVLQRLRKALGYWLYLVAPLVPLKAVLFANKQDEQQQQQQQEQSPQPAQPSVQQAQQGQQQSPQPLPAALSSSAQAGQQQQQQQPAAGPPSVVSSKGAALAATGCLAGFASGLLGIGGGTGEFFLQATDCPAVEVVCWLADASGCSHIWL